MAILDGEDISQAEVGYGCIHMHICIYIHARIPS